MNPRLASVLRRILLATVCLAALGGLVVACKQGEGDRCQLDSDCDTGLVCNDAEQECVLPGGDSPIDATTPDFLDAELDPDAPVDAPDDVMQDA